MIFNRGTDTTLEPAYFARVPGSSSGGTTGDYEGRIKKLEEQQAETIEKDTEQDNKLANLEKQIAALGTSCKCDPMSPVSQDTLNGLTFSTQL